MALRAITTIPYLLSTPKPFTPSLQPNPPPISNPNPNPKFLSISAPLSATLSANQVAYQLFDQFSKPPNLRNPEELQTLGPRLTTNTVETVLKDLKGWRAAHEFFRWASWQDGFCHNCYTYNAMASILSRARQRAQLQSLAKEVVSKRCPMTPGALGFLVRCLGHQGLVNEAVFMFEQAKDLFCLPNSYTYNCLLEVLAKLGRVEEVQLRYKEMVEGLGMEPDKFTLTSVLQSYCNAGKLDNVLDIFNKVNEKGWVDKHIFTVLIVAFCKWGKVDQAFELVCRMEDFGMAPGEKTFCVLIHGFVRQGRVDKALEMFEKMKGSGVNGDLALFNILIEGLCEGKELGRALDLYVEMKKSDISPDIRLIKKMISAYCGEGDLVTANRLIEEDGEKLSLSSLVQLYNALLDGLIRCGEVERATMLLREMMKSKDAQASLVRADDCESDDLFKIKTAVLPNADSFTVVICGLCKTRKLDEALSLLKNMIKMGCKGKLLIYNDLINELCIADRLDESYELLRSMKGFGFVPTEFTHNSIFYCLCKRGDASSALDLLREMRGQGHVPWIKHCTMMVQQLCSNGRVAEACGFLDDMVQVGFLPDMVAYSALIHGICRIGDVETALELFRKVSSNCYLPDVIAHNILIDGFCKAGKITVAQSILNEMLEKGLLPSVVTYNIMIDGWCKANRIDEALACFATMMDDAKPATAVTCTSIIDGLCSAGRAEDAIMFWNEMREKGCVLNKVTYMALVHGLCKCGKVDAAILYFLEMKERGMEPDTLLYLLVINSLILNGDKIKAFELLKEVLQKENFPNIDSKNYQLMRKAVCRLYKDVNTYLDVKILIEGCQIPMIQSVSEIGEDLNE